MTTPTDHGDILTRNDGQLREYRPKSEYTTFADGNIERHASGTRSGRIVIVSFCERALNQHT